jgi:chromosome segregation ATPase
LGGNSMEAKGGINDKALVQKTTPAMAAARLCEKLGPLAEPMIALTDAHKAEVDERLNSVTSDARGARKVALDTDKKVVEMQTTLTSMEQKVTDTKALAEELKTSAAGAKEDASKATGVLARVEELERDVRITKASAGAAVEEASKANTTADEARTSADHAEELMVTAERLVAEAKEAAQKAEGALHTINGKIAEVVKQVDILAGMLMSVMGKLGVEITESEMDGIEAEASKAGGNDE